jgi:hypothetical protein
MSLLEFLENKVSSTFFRREIRYEILNDFTSSHLSMLRQLTGHGIYSISREDTDFSRGAQSYVDDRRDFRKDMVECQLQAASSKAFHTMLTTNSCNNKPSKKRKREIEVGQVKPLVTTLVSTYCLQQTQIIKQKMLDQRQRYVELRCMLKDHTDTLQSNYPELQPSRIVRLPLHTFGITHPPAISASPAETDTQISASESQSQYSFTEAANSSTIRSSTTSTCTNTSTSTNTPHYSAVFPPTDSTSVRRRLDSLLEAKLVTKLQTNLQNSVQFVDQPDE